MLTAAPPHVQQAANDLHDHIVEAHGAAAGQFFKNLLLHLPEIIGFLGSLGVLSPPAPTPNTPVNPNVTTA